MPHTLANRENHGLVNPCGLAGRVAAGAGVGWKIPTRHQPSPAARVGPARCGLSIFREGWPSPRVVSFCRRVVSPPMSIMSVRSPRCLKSPLQDPALILFWCSVCRSLSDRRRSKQVTVRHLDQRTSTKFFAINKVCRVASCF